MYQRPTYRRPISKRKATKCQLGFEGNHWSGQMLDVCIPECLDAVLQHTTLDERTILTFLQSIYVGLSAFTERRRSRVVIAISLSTYLVDCLELEFTHDEFQVPSSAICDGIIAELERYSRTYLEKIIGVALPRELYEVFPSLCSRLWMELDCIPLVIERDERPRRPEDHGSLSTYHGWNDKSLDEQADSMVRKCIRYPWLPS